MTTPEPPGKAAVVESSALFQKTDNSFSVPLHGASVAESSSVLAALANRGARFPEIVDSTEELKVVDELKESTALRWRLKSSVVGILKAREGERSYAVCGCGHAAQSKGEDGQLQTVSSVRLYGKSDDRPTVGVSGVLRCQSPWLCPTCAPGRAKQRRERLKDVMERTDALGGASAFVTLTISHKLEMSLGEVKALLSKASRRARQGRKWKEIQEIGGVLGVVQGVEVLHNKRTGWHYHAHLLVPCTERPYWVRKAMRELVDRYLVEVSKLGGKAEPIGQDVQVVRDTVIDGDRVANYATKGSASWEIAGGLKSARARESRTPWDLAQLANAGDEEAKRLFVEYAENIIGTRSCVVSAALAKKLHMQAADDDDEPDMKHGEDEAPVIEIVTDKWRKLLSYGVAWKVIDAVEQGQETEAVADVVDELMSDIDRREARKWAEYQAREKARRTVRIEADELAQTIVSNRRAEITWSRSKRLAVDYHVRQLKQTGRTFVLPSEDEIGRAVVRQIEARW